MSLHYCEDVEAHALQQQSAWMDQTGYSLLRTSIGCSTKVSFHLKRMAPRMRPTIWLIGLFGVWGSNLP